MGASLPLLLDDVPQPRYGTFHDPGAVLMPSLILGNALPLLPMQGGRWLL